MPACSAAIDSTFSCVFIICSHDVHVTVRCCLQVRFDSSSAAAQNAQESSRALYPRLTLKGFDLSRTFTTHSVSPRALFTPVLGHSDHKTDARNCLGRSRESRGQHVRCGYCAVWTAGKPYTRVYIDEMSYGAIVATMAAQNVSLVLRYDAQHISNCSQTRPRVAGGSVCSVVALRSGREAVPKK